MSSTAETISLVAPVYRNQDTLVALVGQVAAALADRTWRLRLVVDASPDASLSLARQLAAADSRVNVTALGCNLGQHRALVAGLVEEAGATSWVCLDADLQDPPIAVPALLERLGRGDVSAVFGGRRGRYESPGRLLTGHLHRAVLNRLSNVPVDAGAFVAMGPEVREAVVSFRAPSIVAAIGAAGLPLASVPVERDVRPSGRSSWRSSARVHQSLETLAWAARQRVLVQRTRPQPASEATTS